MNYADLTPDMLTAVRILRKLTANFNGLRFCFVFSRFAHYRHKDSLEKIRSFVGLHFPKDNSCYCPVFK